MLLRRVFSAAGPALASAALVSSVSTSPKQTQCEHLPNFQSGLRLGLIASKHGGKAEDRTDGLLISNPAEFVRKMKLLVEGGPQKVYVVADFDRTITTCFMREADGKTIMQPPCRGMSCHGVVEKTAGSPEFKKGTQALFDKYYPIEIDSSLTHEQKLPHMRDWYAQVNELWVKEDITNKTIAGAVADIGPRLTVRPGFKEVLATVQKHDIPLLVFSAGIADVIGEVFRQRLGVAVDSDGCSGSMQIISNWMEFNGQGRLCRFRPPLIHMFNKDTSQTKGTAFEDSVQKSKRCHVVLLGDGLGDVSMANGLESDAILRIGFLNEKISKSVHKYRDAYDLLILADGDMSIVNSILDEIIG